MAYQKTFARASVLTNSEVPKTINAPWKIFLLNTAIDGQEWRK